MIISYHRTIFMWRSWHVKTLKICEPPTPVVAALRVGGVWNRGAAPNDKIKHPLPCSLNTLSPR